MEWIRAGAKALASNADLLEAFIAMNRAMKVVGASKGYVSWRLFQIAWIVGCLPAVADPTADRDVQIETVETGGGKSEAYLGVVLLHLFHARLTGGTAGVMRGHDSRCGCCPRSRRPDSPRRCSLRRCCAKTTCG